MMAQYKFLVGIRKTFKNSAVLLIPFWVAVLTGLPIEYAWLTGPVIYLLKNYYSNK